MQMQMQQMDHGYPTLQTYEQQQQQQPQQREFSKPGIFCSLSFGGVILCPFVIANSSTTSGAGKDDSPNKEYQPSQAICMLKLNQLIDNDNQDSNKGSDPTGSSFQPLLPSAPMFHSTADPNAVCEWIESTTTSTDDKEMNDGEIEGSTDLLWRSIAAMIKANARGPRGQGNESFEQRVLSLLSAPPSSSASTMLQSIVPTAQQYQQQQRPAEQAVMTKLDLMLAKGELEKALKLATENEMWPIAMVIANHVGASAYRKVVQSFASKVFPTSSSTFQTLQLLSGSGSDAILENASLGPGNVSQTWKQTLRSIIANGIPDSTEVLEVLGDKIWRETGSVSAAHICYLLAGHSILEHGDQARIFLLGSDHISTRCRNFFVSPSSIRRSECFLYALCLATEQILASQESDGFGEESRLFLDILKSKLELFQPFRLVYAMWLADAGEIELARSWVNSIMESKPAMDDGFARQLEIFNDRLSQCCEGGSGTMDWELLDTGIENEMSFQQSNAQFSEYTIPQQQLNFDQEPPAVQFHDMYGQDAQQQDAFANHEEPRQMDWMNPNLAENNSLAFGNQATPNTNGDGNHDHGKNQPIQEQGAKPLASMASINGNGDEKSPSLQKQNQDKPKIAEPPSRSVNDGMGDSFGGLRGWIVQKVWGIPKNATVAKVGRKMEAYFDKDKKKWIFPGDPDEPEPAALPPPPSMGASNKDTQTSNSASAPTPGMPGPAMGGAAPQGNPFSRANQGRNLYVDPFQTR